MGTTAAASCVKGILYWDIKNKNKTKTEYSKNKTKTGCLRGESCLLLTVCLFVVLLFALWVVTVLVKSGC
jgi:hypothetical protein